MKTIWFVLTLWSATAFAQGRQELLRQERQQLVYEWKTIAERNSGLFGNKSKDDLQAEVGALEKIIKKDEQILEEYNRSSDREKLSQTQQYNELLRQNNDLNARIKELQDLVTRHKQWSKENHTTLEEKDISQQAFAVLFFVSAAAAIVFWQKYRSAQAALKKSQGWKV